MAVAGILAVGLIAFLLLFNKEGPRSAAAQFLSALAKGNATKVAELSVVHNEPADQIRKEWKESISYGRGYVFMWDIIAVTQHGDNATVRLDFTKNPQLPQSYAEHYELSLVKVGDGWKVDVAQMPRDMYPYLPR